MAQIPLGVDRGEDEHSTPRGMSWEVDHKKIVNFERRLKEAQAEGEVRLDFRTSAIA